MVLFLFPFYTWGNWLKEVKWLDEGHKVYFLPNSGLVSFSFSFFKKILFIYSWDTHTHTHTHTHRGRDTGRERSRLHAGSPMWDLILGLQDHTPGCRRRQTALSLGLPPDCAFDDSRSHGLTPVFSYRSSNSFMFRSDLFWVSFVYGAKYMDSKYLYFEYACLIVPVPFVEKAILS